MLLIEMDSAGSEKARGAGAGAATEAAAGATAGAVVAAADVAIGAALGPVPLDGATGAAGADF